MSFSPVVQRWCFSLVLSLAFASGGRAQNLAPLEPARAQVRAHQWQAALQEFNRVAEQMKTSPEFFFERGNAYAEAKDNPHAKEDFNAAIRLRPDYREAWYMRGHIFARQANHKKAIEQFAEVIRLDPKYADGYRYRGLSYYETNQMEPALSDFETALQLQPKMGEAYFFKARVLRRRGNLSAALEELEHAVDLQPKNAEWLYEHGQVLMWMGEAEKAIADYTECIRLNPTKQHYYNDRASVYSGQGKHDLAILDLNEAIRLKPQLPFFHQGRGQNYMGLEEYQKALEDFSEAIRLKGEATECYRLRARAYDHLQQKESALADMQKALETATAHRPLEQCACTYLEMNEYPLALATIEKALALNPECPEGRLVKGSILSNLERYDEALALMQDCLHEAPDRGKPLQSIALCYFQQGDFQEASDYYTKALTAGEAGSTVGDRLIANFRGENFDQLRSDFDDYTADEGWEKARSTYLAIMCALGQRHLHEEAAAQALVEEALAKAKQSRWSTNLLRYYAGQQSAEDLLKTCSDLDQQTDAHTYVGLLLAAKGEAEAAKVHLQWVREQGLKTSPEYKLSGEELQRLARKK